MGQREVIDYETVEKVSTERYCDNCDSTDNIHKVMIKNYETQKVLEPKDLCDVCATGSALKVKSPRRITYEHRLMFIVGLFFSPIVMFLFWMYTDSIAYFIALSIITIIHAVVYHLE